MSQLSGKKVDSIGFQKGGGGSRIGIFLKELEELKDNTLTVVISSNRTVGHLHFFSHFPISRESMEHGVC